MEPTLSARDQIVFKTISTAYQKLNVARGDLEMVLARLELMNAVSVYSELLTSELESLKSD